MTDVIISETYQCPLCAEKDYILETTMHMVVIQIICLSCGYDGSNTEDFIEL